MGGGLRCRVRCEAKDDTGDRVAVRFAVVDPPGELNSGGVLTLWGVHPSVASAWSVGGEYALGVAEQDEDDHWCEARRALAPGPERDCAACRARDEARSAYMGRLLGGGQSAADLPDEPLSADDLRRAKGMMEAEHHRGGR